MKYEVADESERGLTGFLKNNEGIFANGDSGIFYYKTDSNYKPTSMSWHPIGSNELQRLTANDKTVRALVAGQNPLNGATYNSLIEKSKVLKFNDWLATKEGVKYTTSDKALQENKYKEYLIELLQSDQPLYKAIMEYDGGGNNGSVADAEISWLLNEPANMAEYISKACEGEDPKDMDELLNKLLNVLAIYADMSFLTKNKGGNHASALEYLGSALSSTNMGKVRYCIVVESAFVYKDRSTNTIDIATGVDLMQMFYASNELSNLKTGKVDSYTGGIDEMTKTSVKKAIASGANYRESLASINKRDADLFNIINVTTGPSIFGNWTIDNDGNVNYKSLPSNNSYMTQVSLATQDDVKGFGLIGYNLWLEKASTPTPPPTLWFGVTADPKTELVVGDTLAPNSKVKVHLSNYGQLDELNIPFINYIDNGRIKDGTFKVDLRIRASDPINDKDAIISPPSEFKTTVKTISETLTNDQLKEKIKNGWEFEDNVSPVPIKPEDGEIRIYYVCDGKISLTQEYGTDMANPDKTKEWKESDSPDTPGTTFYPGKLHSKEDWGTGPKRDHDENYLLGCDEANTCVDRDYASWVKEEVPPPPEVIQKPRQVYHYRTVPHYYSEIKNKEPLGHEWEAMAGVPTTEQLYYSVGGSQFIIDIELEFIPDAVADRFYEYDIKPTLCSHNGHGICYPDDENRPHGNNGNPHEIGKNEETGEILYYANEHCGCEEHSKCKECWTGGYNYGWCQKTIFEYMKINHCEVWQLKDGVLLNTEKMNLTKDGKIIPKQEGDMSGVRFHIAEESWKGGEMIDAAECGRLSYSYKPTSYDSVNILPGAVSFPNCGSYTNKCVGSRCEDTGDLYTQGFANNGKDAGGWSAAVSAEMEKTNSAYAVSDFLILYTVDGDQAVFYFEKESDAKPIHPTVYDFSQADNGEKWEDKPKLEQMFTHTNGRKYNEITTLIVDKVGAEAQFQGSSGGPCIMVRHVLL